MVSQQLVEQWRVRLAAWQQRLNEGRPRPWLARAYVRVLKFLLAQYGAGGDWSEPARTNLAEHVADAEAPRDRSAMRFEAVSPQLSGKPPRSAGDIRSVLEVVKTKVPQAEQGPLAGGLHSDDPIVVAAYYHPGVAAQLKEQLKAAGIESRSKRFRRQTQVSVRAADLERAKPIAAWHAADGRDSSAWRVQYSQWVAIICGVLGILLGFVVAALSFGANDFVPAGFVFGLVFGVLLSCTGFVVGVILDG